MSPTRRRSREALTRPTAANYVARITAVMDGFRKDYDNLACAVLLKEADTEAAKSKMKLFADSARSEITYVNENHKPKSRYNLDYIPISESIYKKSLQSINDHEGLLLYIVRRLEDDRHSSQVYLPSRQERLEIALRYAKANGDKGLLEYMAALFPDLVRFIENQKNDQSAAIIAAEAAIPIDAPEIYQGLRGPETPPAFVKRV